VPLSCTTGPGAGMTVIGSAARKEATSGLACNCGCHCPTKEIQPTDCVEQITLADKVVAFRNLYLLASHLHSDTPREQVLYCGRSEAMRLGSKLSKTENIFPGSASTYAFRQTSYGMN
jgi:hypothetical protein